MQNTTQEHSLGCAVACVASRCGISYRRALALFDEHEHAWTRGYYCVEVVAALARFGLDYAFVKFNALQHTGLLKEEGTIVFVDVCKAYPAGHYLIRSRKGWMNPWSNFPRMDRAQSAFQRKLVGRAAYLIYEINA